MTAKRSVRCAIYTRKSTEEGLEQDFNSLDAQREACEAYVTSQKAEGWIALREHYDDGGFSGGTLDRPALKRLLADIEESRIDIVVVYKIDRLSRSLMDFAKLVEVFDRRSVTFVSVTQSFNTTNSMGRLTLNVLLSFAQFEREVTGERIRDKIAASKRKGIWMGGNPPLGYDVADRKLIVNEAEAKTVRYIFGRFLELDSISVLAADLGKSGIVSKRRAFRSGKRLGGRFMGMGALHSPLANRTYLGETLHKGRSYNGEHEAIISKGLFASVQEKLAATPRIARSKVRSEQDAPFLRLLFDETGEEMVPHYVQKANGARYRYYVSRSSLKGGRSKAAIARIPAPAFESFLASVLARFGLPSAGQFQLQSVIQRIEIQPNAVCVRLHSDATFGYWRSSDIDSARLSDADIIEARRSALASGETLAENGRLLVFTLPVRARFHGGRTAIIYPMGAKTDEPTLDGKLIKAVARAHHWRRMLIDGEVHSIEELALRLGQERGYVGLTLKLAYLSPTLTRAILRGEQPRALTISRVLNADLPVSWHAQEHLFGAPISTEPF